MPNLFDAREITLDEQIKVVSREIGWRRYVYPRRVANGKMTQAEADRGIDVMEAVIESLQELQAKG